MAGYDAVHRWAKNLIQKPNGCEVCGEDKPLDLASTTHQRKDEWVTGSRNLKDWKYLCKSCHWQYDINDGRLEHLRNISKKGLEARWQKKLTPKL